MKSISNNVKSEYVIEKSRFINFLFNVTDINKVKDIIEALKKEYYDSTHVVYSYIIDGVEKSNDDNEPKGTAGLPSLEVLRKEGLTNILSVTVRYFGGIKLGAGGLLRAYTKSLTESLKLVNYTYENKILNYKLIMNYKDASIFERKFKDYLFINKEFSDEVIFNISIKEEMIKSLNDELVNYKEYKLDKIGEEIKFI